VYSLARIGENNEGPYPSLLMHVPSLPFEQYSKISPLLSSDFVHIYIYIYTLCFLVRLRDVLGWAGCSGSFGGMFVECWRGVGATIREQKHGGEAN
jgi:hypothetical protein